MWSLKPWIKIAAYLLIMCDGIKIWLCHFSWDTNNSVKIGRLKGKSHQRNICFHWQPKMKVVIICNHLPLSIFLFLFKLICWTKKVLPFPKQIWYFVIYMFHICFRQVIALKGLFSSLFMYTGIDYFVENLCHSFLYISLRSLFCSLRWQAKRQQQSVLN